LVHGLLHLIGYDHEINVYQKKKMEKKERELSMPLRKWLKSTNFAIEGILHGAKTRGTSDTIFLQRPLYWF